MKSERKVALFFGLILPAAFATYPLFIHPMTTIRLIAATGFMVGSYILARCAQIGFPEYPKLGEKLLLGTGGVAIWVTIACIITAFQHWSV